MIQKPWFKIFIWFASTVFFFLASVILISYFNPAPTQDQTMKFMMGMMESMHGSMMGLSMGLESNNSLKSLIILATGMTIPLSLIAAVFAIIIRLWRKKNA
ncbi:uncharacterized membrane protein YcgQ (UPF0703/DUF1980 family) [Anaerosolibacter carboniphilus]|uniref:Uncharacterized membrane protein YcgQ (UPF0703/DUF1980 family) n=1 Tax=Anaerosolibacter carboniphilus TaxID=1417629 RepID=A0A841KPW9_9FIRM|nr:SKG-like transmembrane protein [Anaerosolibacter carboniphilus]MBB6215473.1 uncharacterized membrane protein YcgQ (UPF0703/DUF1980 family) [Anaerosolibacter carboniphilus]